MGLGSKAEEKLEPKKGDENIIRTKPGKIE